MDKKFIDVVEAVGRRLAAAITPSVVDGPDATYRNVGSLTEAVMGVTAGLMHIADALDRVADSFGDIAQAMKERTS